MLERYNDILTVLELCGILHIGKNKAYELLKTNQIKYKRIGNQYRISKASLITYINS